MIVVPNETGFIGALQVKDVEHFLKWNPNVKVDVGAFVFIINK